MRKYCLVLLLYGFVSTLTAQENGIIVHNGMSSGQEYLKMSEREKRAYAMGVVNGILLSPAFGAPKQKLTWFENCVEGMSDQQAAEVLRQYIQKRPAEWHYGLNILSLGAFNDACADSPAKRNGHH